MSDDPHRTPDTPFGYGQTTDAQDAQDAHDMTVTQAPTNATGWEDADTLTRLGRIAKRDTDADAPTAPLDGAALAAATAEAITQATPARAPVIPQSASVATAYSEPYTPNPTPFLHDGHNGANRSATLVADDSLADDLAPTEAALPTPGEALRLPPWRRGPAERPGGRQAPAYSYGSLGVRKGGPKQLVRASAHAEAQTHRVWRPRMIFVAFAALGVVGLLAAVLLASIITAAAGRLFAPSTASPGTNTLVIPSTAPTSRTPGAHASVAPGGGFLSGSPRAAPRVINLTTLTTTANSDWAQWGLTTASDFTHKASGAGQIGNYSVIGGAGPQQITDAAIAYSWSDGQPTANATGSTTGVSVAGAGAGLSFSVPASASARTLTVYVSSYHAEGVFTATLTDNSATPYTDTTVSGVNGVVTGVYTLTFQARSGGHHLVISFTDQTNYQPDGYVSLQAATLN